MELYHWLFLHGINLDLAAHEANSYNADDPEPPSTYTPPIITFCEMA
jgi:hypothetical protein